jgi:hypothetical protein
MNWTPKKMIQWINETKSWFFKKVKKIDQQSVNQLTKRRKKNQTDKIRDEKGNITTDTNEIQNNIWEYFKNLYSNKLETEEEIDKFLDIWLTKIESRVH